ncbi:MAG: HNH endonuclease [Roseovarius sp.]|nr:HNH endonuclease [Roseovarius sp.]
MSEVMKALRSSTDPLENDLARVYEHWQEVKRSQGQRAGLGYEPRDIRAKGPEEVISSRILNASAGFEEVDPNQSYEALVLKYPDRFTPDVIAAARERLNLGASKLNQIRRQDIQFFVKSRAFDLFGELGIQPLPENWIGRDAHLPVFLKEYRDAERFMSEGFRSLVWLHEQSKHGESGKGLTAVAEFGPMQPDRHARVLDAVFFDHPIGKAFLDSHRGDQTFVAKIVAFRPSRIWPISDADVDSFMSAVRERAHQFAQYENHNPDPHEPLNLEKIEDTTALRQVVLRRYQSAFRQALLSKRPNRCAITGTSELSVLEAAHIIPYAERFADRDKPENGLLLRSDIHKLFDAHLISINPETKAVEVSDRIASPDYQSLRDNTVSDEVSPKSLGFHFEIFREQHQ